MRSSIAEEPLRSDSRDGLLTLRLNRPDRRHAIDARMRDALAGAPNDDRRDRWKRRC